MKSIAITPAKMLRDEAKYIRSIIDNGWNWVHIRHPESDADAIRQLLDEIPDRYYSRLKLHDNFDIAIEYNLGGIHLNSRNPSAPNDYTGSVSRSCHSIEEVKAGESHDYVTLSPIFDSVSKSGYKRAFSHDDLTLISYRDNVVALGGVTPETLPQLSGYNFVGFAVLGYIFQSNTITELQTRLNKFKPYICYNL